MMRAVITRIVFIAFLLSHAFVVKAHVALDYPHGGETFIVGETITIQWHIVAAHATLNWDLFFSVDSGETWDTLQLDIPTSQLSYEWEVPDSLTTHARIRVIQDNESQNYQDESMDFAIVPNTSPPMLDAPATDMVIECSIADQQAAIQAWLDNHGGAAATNYCGALIWSHDYPGISDGCGATGSAGVTFTAIDECGVITTNATLTIVDTSPPIMIVPATDMVVEADAQGNVPELMQWLNSIGGALASDVCSQISWSNNYLMLSDDCGMSGSASVIFTATDQCGNWTTTAAAFTIQDHTSPSILVTPQPLTISCDAINPENEIQQWLNNLGGAQASDVSGEVEWTNDYSGLSDGCGATGSAAVIFTATDACGNSATTSATVTIIDMVSPVMQASARDTALDCTALNPSEDIQLWLDRHGGAQAEDGCGVITWAQDYVGLSDGCGASGSANVIFTATDECGNTSTTSAALVMTDTLAPPMEKSAMDTTIICGQDDQSSAIEAWLAHHGGASAQDLCGMVTWTHDFPALADTCGPVGSHMITFTAADECGNATSTRAILTIMDTVVTSVYDQHEFNFTIYPNPSRDFIHVGFEREVPGPVHLILYNRLGQIVRTDHAGADGIIIPVESLPRGAHLLKLITTRGSYIRHVLIL